ncbi:Uncharacterised protein [Klebsiella pneumoniae]|uniref:hypothetical protein n=1 Tax=Klebsiella pneumoniae complex TaxID=3390273 RepID=UPI000E2B29D9|nr:MULTISPECIES: hypothetical protein [Klebsiella]SWF03469.1 Uncharacterised protein [Klebsiella pneumoniae]
MQRFVDSIRKAVKDENWFAAIFMALAMPDVCGNLEDPGEGDVGRKYRKWFNQYLKSKYDHENEWERRLAIDPSTAKALMDNAQKDVRAQEYINEQKTKKIERSQNFTAQDCYKFRCACLHAGMAKSQRGPINLTPPMSNGGIVHKMVVNGDLQLQIDIFCEDVCKAVEEWMNNNLSNVDIQNRIKELIVVEPIVIGGFSIFGPYNP